MVMLCCDGVRVCGCAGTQAQGGSAANALVLEQIDQAGANATTSQLGSSKVFIRHPKSVFALEEARERVVPLLVTFIQRMVRRVLTRQWFVP